MLAAPPQRLPTTAPLDSVTFSDKIVWIRTDDGGLWLAPELASTGRSWGYNGTGPFNLAVLLHRLLDDITAPAVDAGDREAPAGLQALTQHAPKTGTVTFTRGQLERARGQ